MKGNPMKKITIKPHHFMDIIKLYGKGIELFVPDEKMGHDFYKVANQIIQDKNTALQLTIYGDDICTPCKSYKDHCIDLLTSIHGFTTKNEYNKALDERMIALFHLDKNKTYTAKELCSIYLNNHELIFQVWKEEDSSITIKRHDWFVKGANKYLQL